MENITFLQNAYLVCFGIAIAAFILAIVLFFLLDIREIILIESGHEQRKTIERMRTRNQKTGKLRDDTEADLSQTGARTVKSAVAEKAAEPDQSGPPYSDVRQKKAQPADSNTVSVPAEKYSQGMLRSSDDIAAAVQSGGTDGRSGNETVVLSSQAVPDIPFRVTKKITITHTDENIPA